MQHTVAIGQIRELDWKSFNPRSIIFVSWYTAQEFAASLRQALALYPNAPTLREMGEGELQTDNLQYGEYHRAGDHAEFLQHFLKGMVVDVRVSNAYAKYLATVEGFSAQERAITIISREQELPGIFERILAAHDWEKLGFGFYEYYLSRHIELDSTNGGHGDLTKQFSQDKSFTLEPEVLERFWTARDELYQEALLPKGSRT
jgi:hypothetical protein